MLIKSFNYNVGEQTISSLFFVDLFESSITECPITSYRLVQKDKNFDRNGRYEDYEGSSISMDEDDFTILIDTDNAEMGRNVAYIEASSANSESKAYLEL